MSNSYNYNPTPPRVWTRVQGRCTDDISFSENVYVPLTNQTVPQGEATIQDKILYKGNILQYKKNSSSLTKKQKYAQISKGLWSNRTKSFASQTQTYTNPNTIGMQRVNYTELPYPNQIVVQPNNISGPFQYNVQNPYDCSSNVIQDGGTLVCNSFVDPCSGKIIQTVSQQQCFPTYCSDVPGPIMNLCWNPMLNTFYPRQTYKMNNSLNKWPQGYKGLVSAVTPAPPTVSILSSPCNPNEITLTWTLNSSVCVPISSYNIYQNGVLINTVSYQITEYTPALQNGETASFYVTSVMNNVESIPSNTVSTTGETVFTATGNYTIFYNNCFTGIVFDYQAAEQSLTLNYPQIVTLIVVGGGGGGTSGGYFGSTGGCGGGGGGTTYIQNLYLPAGTYNINVGSGGSGNTAINGGNSNFDTYTSYGGFGGGKNQIYYAFGGGTNTAYGGGGGMAGTAQPSQIQSLNNASGVNSISGNQGSIILNTNTSTGGSSFYAYNSIPIFVPFISLSSTITVGGGGGAGQNLGGGAGNGQGGASGGSTNINGENAYNSIYTGYGGGGGCGGNFPNPGNGGNGGNGAVIVYWPPYNTSYINANNFVGNYTIYNNNGYIGYVFNYGSGSITFNQNINNVNMILCGGGGLGGDGSNDQPYNIGGGGGGGGSVYYTGLSFTNNQLFSISVGTGGTYSQYSGTNTVFGSNPSYIAYGGSNSPANSCVGGTGGNGNGNGGGGGGGGGGYISSAAALGGTGGFAPGPTHTGNSGDSGYYGATGGNSYLYNNYGGITIPFLPTPTTIQFGGGGQAGNSTDVSSGGAFGLGAGGQGIGTHQLLFGGNGINNINAGFGGGGGGYGYSSRYSIGGSGGNGVIILWWQI